MYLYIMSGIALETELSKRPVPYDVKKTDSY
jgi:hypothetical protein